MSHSKRLAEVCGFCTQSSKHILQTFQAMTHFTEIPSYDIFVGVRKGQEIESGEPDDVIQVPLFDAALADGLVVGLSWDPLQTPGGRQEWGF